MIRRRKEEEEEEEEERGGGTQKDKADKHLESEEIGTLDISKFAFK